MSKKSQRPSEATAGAPQGASVAAVDGQVASEVVTAQDAPTPVGLYGSSVQPALIKIGGEDVQLGVVVAAAQLASELSVQEWNDLAADVREDLIADELAAMQEAAAADQPAAAEHDPSYPRQVTLRNNSGFPASEPVTAAVVGGGASVFATVHTKEQAVRLLQSIDDISKGSGGRLRLVVVGLDDVELPETGDAA